MWAADLPPAVASLSMPVYLGDRYAWLVGLVEYDKAFSREEGDQYIRRALTALQATQCAPEERNWAATVLWWSLREIALRRVALLLAPALHAYARQPLTHHTATSGDDEEDEWGRGGGARKAQAHVSRTDADDRVSRVKLEVFTIVSDTLETAMLRFRHGTDPAAWFSAMSLAARDADTFKLERTLPNSIGHAHDLDLTTDGADVSFEAADLRAWLTRRVAEVIDATPDATPTLRELLRERFALRETDDGPTPGAHVLYAKYAPLAAARGEPPLTRRHVVRTLVATRSALSAALRPGL